MAKLIPEAELRRLRPVEGQSLLVSDLAAEAIAYNDVTINRKDLHRYLQRLRRLAKANF